MKNLGLYEQENTLLNSLMAIKQKAQTPSGKRGTKTKTDLSDEVTFLSLIHI